jgi:hypothetical protein
MAGPEGEERLQGSRGERRFSALNPHGNVDFELPSGGVSEYLGKSDVSMPFLALRRTAHFILKTERSCWQVSSFHNFPSH